MASTPEEGEVISRLAREHGVSNDAVESRNAKRLRIQLLRVAPWLLLWRENYTITSPSFGAATMCVNAKSPPAPKDRSKGEGYNRRQPAGSDPHGRGFNQ
jgi:hypothetical protein